MTQKWFRGVGAAAVLAASTAAYGQGAPLKSGGAPASGAPASSANPEGDPVFKEAARHFEAGGDLLEKKQYDKAVDELTIAYGLLPKPQIAGKLGEAEIALRRYRDAAEHLERFLRELGPRLEADYRKRAEAWLATAKKNVATLTVTVVPPPGAAAGWDAELELLLDGKASGLKGPLPPEVYVEDGKRTVGVRVGNARDDVSGEYKKGAASSITLSPKQAGTGPAKGTEIGASASTSIGTGPATRPGAGAPPVTGSGSALRPALLITGGVLAVGLIGGGAGLLVARDANATDLRKDVQALRDKYGPYPCGEPVLAPAAACKAADDKLQGVIQMRVAATAMFATGGVVAAATLGYWLLPRVVGSQAKGGSGATVIPFATANEGGAVIQGSF